MKEYNIISEYYGNKTAIRSGVPLINHINEGLFILDKINASENAKKAYCLHPILQADEALIINLNLAELQNIPTNIIILTMEYRYIANSYLSKKIISSLDDIKLSPLKDVNDMLIADKIQNKKDFDIYHKNTHERSKELDEYFNNWLERLGISVELYNSIIKHL